LNTLVAFNPFDQTLVEGFAYRRAVDGPPSKIIIADMWLLFPPGLFIALFVIAPDLARVSFVGYFTVGVVILHRATTNYLAKRKTNEPEGGEAKH
jgi:hypothetical protein